MAPTAPRHRLRLPLFLLLLLPGPGRGNEGGGAGSCLCQRRHDPPPFLDKLQSCDTCRDFTRFIFPNRRVCGLREEDWVVRLEESHCGKGRPEEGAEGSSGPHPAAPTAGPTSASPTAAGAGPGKGQETPQGAATAEGQREEAGPPKVTRSPPDPSAEAAARGTSQAPWEEKRAAPPPAPDAKTPSISALLCVAAVAGSVALAYGWRRRRRHRRSPMGLGPHTPQGQQEEGTVCLPAENTWRRL